LFERRTRALELTAAGQRLLEEVEPLLEGLDRALAQLARHDGRETLRVRAPALFANELLIPRLEEFCEAHPLIDVQLDTRDPRPVAHPPTADVSIVLADTPPAGVRSARLFSSPLTAVCAPQHAGRVARLGREVFGTLPLIVDRNRPLAWSSWAEEVGVERPEPRQLIEFDTMIAAVRAAERGLGIALVPVVDRQRRVGARVRRGAGDARGVLPRQPAARRRAAASESPHALGTCPVPQCMSTAQPCTQFFSFVRGAASSYGRPERCGTSA